MNWLKMKAFINYRISNSGKLNLFAPLLLGTGMASYRLWIIIYDKERFCSFKKIIKEDSGTLNAFLLIHWNNCNCKVWTECKLGEWNNIQGLYLWSKRKVGKRFISIINIDVIYKGAVDSFMENDSFFLILLIASNWHYVGLDIKKITFSVLKLSCEYVFNGFHVAANDSFFLIIQN